MPKDKNLRLRFDAAFKGRLDHLWHEKKVSQQVAVESILTWFLDQDSLLQSMILGQIEADRRLLRVAIERMGESRTSDRKTSRKS